MYQLHSCHDNPDPEFIHGSCGVRGTNLYVQTYHPDWYPLWLAKGIHELQVLGQFRALDWNVNSSDIPYEVLPYVVERTYYPTDFPSKDPDWSDSSLGEPHLAPASERDFHPDFVYESWES